MSIVPLLSKVYKRIMFNHLSSHAKYFSGQILCGFRKTHKTQHALFRLLQPSQRQLYESECVGTILMDLSKAYDCIPHQLFNWKTKIC